MSEQAIREIAVYGKGGIGKSTISANLSAALAMKGQSVLQIGCDPKHDSTRLLMHGENIRTVLEYLMRTDADRAVPEMILHHGYRGIGCIEAGGPKPGVGCAGRGIISAFEFLDKHKIKEQYQQVIYDVLGDVVCGGFAVPVRQEYADAVILVTSGEYMAIYAANNILRGIQNNDSMGRRRVAGIVYNERLLEDEDQRVHRFAEAVGLPVLAKVPRSGHFQEAEAAKVTLMELAEQQEATGRITENELFADLADRLVSGMELYAAEPLEDEELEQVVLGTHMSAASAMDHEPAGRQGTGAKTNADSGEQTTDDRPPERLPLYGCAFNGAATTGVHLQDSIVIAHAPRACGFFTWQNLSSAGRRNLYNRGILMPSAINPHFVCSEMGDREVVFGGMDKLRETVKRALEQKPRTILVISACVSGIIGDDILQIEDMSTEETRVIAIPTDGDISGDYMAGICQVMHTLAERLIDPQVKPAGKSVNIINEVAISNNTALNYDIIRGLLDRMGIQVNCRFLGDTTTDRLEHFLQAPLNVLATSSQDSLELKAWLQEKYNCRFLEAPFPIGFASSGDWIRSIGDFFDCREAADAIVAGEEDVYHDSIRRLRPALSGKKVLMTTINSNLDWLIEAIYEAGMEIVWIGVINYLHFELNITTHEEYQIPIEEEFDLAKVRGRIQQLHPDFVISNYMPNEEKGDFILDAMSMSSVAGFHSAVYVLERWAKLLQTNKKGAWQDDRKLFEKYYS